ncbi:hypothetical protein D1614_21490 [Maribellus luteus]|uniref:Sensor of ECF-type sigma factor n=1 Tax=Maribellus luteus TaxID=2305463 RepID=A0A399SSI6_9BACT|nr:hypothetical protein [Maribellus luteus]RIJ45884.1 hypothetical protein D1614_21490 [Maribellus luteus]
MINKTLYIVSLTLLFFVQSVVVHAQHDKSDRWEKFRAEKVSFLTDKLDLTPEEAQSFWPVYNKMEKERMDAQMARRELEKQVRDAGETMSDKEIIKLTREFAQKMDEEGTLATKYNEQFLKILPPQKVLKMYKAEGEFRMYMFRKYRDQREGETKKD